MDLILSSLAAKKTGRTCSARLSLLCQVVATANSNFALARAELSLQRENACPRRDHCQRSCRRDRRNVFQPRCTCSQAAASFRPPVHRGRICGLPRRHVCVGPRSRRVPVGVRGTGSDPVTGRDACTRPCTRSHAGTHAGRLGHADLGRTKTKADGSALRDLAGFKIYYGTVSGNSPRVDHRAQPGCNDTHHSSLAGRHVLLCREGIRQEQYRKCAVSRGQQDDPIGTLAVSVVAAITAGR